MSVRSTKTIALSKSPPFISEHPLLNYEKVLKTYNVKRFSDISDNDLNREFVLS